MERKGNYFMPHNGQIGFSPLHMLGLSAIHPKSMQHDFVDVSVNTHTVDNNFSLFKYKDQGNETVNMKNKLINQFGNGLPAGKSFSKLIGGFIGSKCLIGSSTGRENNFWGRVLQQYNNIIGTNSNLYISMSAMNTEGNTGEYIKANAVDAALLFSQSFNMFCTNNLMSHEQTMDTTKTMSAHETPLSSVESQAQETVTTEPKQSYAEVTKSGVVSKSPHCAASDRCSTVSKRLRPIRRNPEKLRQKKQSFSASSNNNWKYRDHHDVFGKYMDSTNYRREPHRKHCIVPHDDRHKSVSAVNSTNGTPHTLEDLKRNHLRTSRVQHTASNRKLPGKRKLNSNLLSDIKEDCLGVYGDLMPFEKKGSYSHNFNPLNKRLTPSNDQKSASNHCANWRCRPYRLCDPCKKKDFYGNAVSDCYGPQIQHEVTTREIVEKEKNIESNVPDTSVTSLPERKTDVSSSKPISCSDPSMTDYEILIAAGHPIRRTRISSECSVDSEDSFIMFDASADDSYDETNSSETASVCSDSDCSSNDEEEDKDDDASSLTYELYSDNDDCDGDDEIDCDGNAELGLICVSKTELKEANARWESAYEDIPSAEKEPEKVQFANTPELTKVHKIIAWDFAYRAARLGPWELIARDRIRFHRRIEHLNIILSPVLQDHHRRHVWLKFHKETLGVP